MTGNGAVDIRRHAFMTKLSEGSTLDQATKVRGCVTVMLSITVKYPLSIFVL